jgi:hypothetical protein
LLFNHPENQEFVRLPALSAEQVNSIFRVTPTSARKSSAVMRHFLRRRLPLCSIR